MSGSRGWREEEPDKAVCIWEPCCSPRVGEVEVEVEAGAEELRSIP